MSSFHSEKEEADGRQMFLDGGDSMYCSILDSRLMMSLICVGSSISQEERRCQRVWTWGMSVRQSHYSQSYILIHQATNMLVH
jgi:hypothetical protein